MLQQVVPLQSYPTALHQKESREDRNQVEENNNNDSRKQVEQSFKLVLFGDSTTKLIVPDQTIKCAVNMKPLTCGVEQRWKIFIVK